MVDASLVTSPQLAPPDGASAVLCVDDAPEVLDVLRRSLMAEFDVDVVDSPVAAMGRLVGGRRYAVVISDLQMPLVDGITLLRRAHDLQPDAARVLLTGHADVDSAKRAVNEGALHHFLTKPCPPAELVAVVREAVAGHATRCADRQALDETLRGAVRTLTGLLGLGNARAHARAERITHASMDLLEAAGMPQHWEVEVAFVLSQLGSITLPDRLLDRLQRGQPLDAADRVNFEAVPERGAAMVAQIPRMGLVADAIRHQLTGFDGSGPPGTGRQGLDLPLASRVLRIAIDADALQMRDMTAAQVVGVLQQSHGIYDPDLVEALALARGSAPSRQIPVADLLPGMRVDQDVHALDGDLLIGRGVVLNDRLANLLRRRMGPDMADARVLVAMP